MVLSELDSHYFQMVWQSNKASSLNNNVEDKWSVIIMSLTSLIATLSTKHLKEQLDLLWRENFYITISSSSTQILKLRWKQKHISIFKSFCLHLSMSIDRKKFLRLIIKSQSRERSQWHKIILQRLKFYQFKHIAINISKDIRNTKTRSADAANRMKRRLQKNLWVNFRQNWI